MAGSYVTYKKHPVLKRKRSMQLYIGTQPTFRTEAFVFVDKKSLTLADALLCAELRHSLVAATQTEDAQLGPLYSLVAIVNYDSIALPALHALRANDVALHTLHALSYSDATTRTGSTSSSSSSSSNSSSSSSSSSSSGDRAWRNRNSRSYAPLRFDVAAPFPPSSHLVEHMDSSVRTN